MATADLKALLGATIRSNRLALGISQEELAYRAGLHRTYISDVERGARNPSVASVQKLARALDISVSMLFEQADDSSPAKRVVEILLVEDRAREVQLTLRAFEKAKITNPVHVVRDGVEALDFILATGQYSHRRNASSPQIILLDLNLPNKSGLEVLQQIKGNDATRDIPVILLTTSDRKPDLAEFRRWGAVAHMVKPVEFRNFTQVTARLSLAWALVKAEGGHVRSDLTE
jgi:CheY-like chemotaxis protein